MHWRHLPHVDRTDRGQPHRVSIDPVRHRRQLEAGHTSRRLESTHCVYSAAMPCYAVDKPADCGSMSRRLLPVFLPAFLLLSGLAFTDEAAGEAPRPCYDCEMYNIMQSDGSQPQPEPQVSRLPSLQVNRGWSRRSVGYGRIGRLAVTCMFRNCD